MDKIPGLGKAVEMRIRSDDVDVAAGFGSAAEIQLIAL